MILLTTLQIHKLTLTLNCKVLYISDNYWNLSSEKINIQNFRQASKMNVSVSLYYFLQNSPVPRKFEFLQFFNKFPPLEQTFFNLEILGRISRLVKAKNVDIFRNGICINYPPTPRISSEYIPESIFTSFSLSVLLSLRFSSCSSFS